MTAKYEPRRTRTYWMRSCSEPTTEWHIEASYSKDSLGLYKISPHCWYHPYLLNSSPIININVYNNVWIGAPVSARALCQERLREKNPGRLSQTGLGGLVVLKHRVASWSLQRHNQRIVMNSSGMCPYWRTSAVTTTSLSAPYHFWADGEPQKPHSVLAQSPRRLRCFMLTWKWEHSVAFGVTVRKSG